jgi:quinoprotein relay system zinc metallohydrolase 2
VARGADSAARRGARLSAGVVLAWAVGAWAQPPDLQDFQVANPAPGVYVHYGVQAEMTAVNAGDIANLGFVVGTTCVAVIDTGGSYAVGLALRAAIRNVTTLPVCYVINTHVHPDHVFGNQAFVADEPQFVGHARLAEALRRRGPNYLRALMRDVGDAAQGSTIVLPTLAVADVRRLDLGGRSLTLRAWPTAHTDTDLTVFDETSGTFWPGDLLFVGHLPVVDGSLRGFIAVIDEIRKIPAQRAIPGHGHADAWPAALLPEERYLKRLLRDVRAALAARMPMAEAMETVACDDANDWLLVDEFHKRNVSAAYAELEWEQ